MDDDEAASKFCEEDIDQILDRRAQTVTIESGEKGSTFSKVIFVMFCFPQTWNHLGSNSYKPNNFYKYGVFFFY